MNGPTEVGAQFRMLKPLWITSSNVGWFSVKPGSVRISTGQVLKVIEIANDGTPCFGPKCSESQAAFEKSGAKFIGISYRHLARFGQIEAYESKLVEINSNGSLENYLRTLTQ